MGKELVIIFYFFLFNVSDISGYTLSYSNLYSFFWLVILQVNQFCCSSPVVIFFCSFPPAVMCPQRLIRIFPFPPVVYEFFHREVGERHISGVAYVFKAAVSTLSQVCTMDFFSLLPYLQSFLWTSGEEFVKACKFILCLHLSGILYSHSNLHSVLSNWLKMLAVFFLSAYMTPSSWPMLSKCSSCYSLISSHLSLGIKLAGCSASSAF